MLIQGNHHVEKIPTSSGATKCEVKSQIAFKHRKMILASSPAARQLQMLLQRQVQEQTGANKAAPPFSLFSWASTEPEGSISTHFGGGLF